jgi:hypothetical protein
VQNLAESREFARQLHKRGAFKVLTKLVQSPEQRVVRFAAGALKNARDELDASPTGEEEDGPPSPLRRQATRALSRASSVLAASPLPLVRWGRNESPSKMRGGQPAPAAPSQSEVDAARHRRLQEDQELLPRTVWAATRLQAGARIIVARRRVGLTRQQYHAATTFQAAIRRKQQQQRVSVYWHDAGTRNEIQTRHTSCCACPCSRQCSRTRGSGD